MESEVFGRRCVHDPPNAQCSGKFCHSGADSRLSNIGTRERPLVGAKEMRTSRIVISGIPAALAFGVYFIAVHDSAESPSAYESVPASPAHERVVHDARQSSASRDRASFKPKSPTATELGFKLTSEGELVIDEATRGVVEAVSAVADVSELREIKAHLQQSLPSPAGDSAADLVDRYYRYRIALEEQLRSEEMLEVAQDPRIGLQALQALRTAFFGTELAGLWFGKEEALSREVIARDDRAR